MAKHKSWNEKLATSKPHVVKRLDKNFAGMISGQQMLVPSPALLDAFINTLAEGKSMTVAEMRAALAYQHEADVTCPIATGFAMKIVAEAAFENLDKGKPITKITPVWRVLDKDSKTLKKVSFDPSAMLSLREAEGIVSLSS